MKMDFLFATLPASNFQMTDEQLVLWQRNAIFECECDNLINQRIENDIQLRRPSSYLGGRTSRLENVALDAAIQEHGLRVIRQHSLDSYNYNYFISSPSAPQRPRLLLENYDRDHIGGNDDAFYQASIAAAIRDRGLRRERNSFRR